MNRHSRHMHYEGALNFQGERLTKSRLWEPSEAQRIADRLMPQPHRRTPRHLTPVTIRKFSWEASGGVDQ